MLIKVAWRNIWRSKVRSFVVIGAIAIGLFAGVFASAFVQGMMKQKIESVIKLEMSDFQIHQPGFTDEYLAKLYVEDAQAKQAEIEAHEHVLGSSSRIISMGMMGTPAKNGSIKIMGVDETKEAIVTGLDEKVIEGEYFEGAKRNPVLISQKTAEDYKLKLRSKVVLTIQDVHGEITAGAFRVVGIYKSENTMFDKMNIYVRQDDLGRLMGIENGVHEIAVLLDDHQMAEPIAAEYQSKYTDLEVKPWLDLATGMRFMVDAMDIYLYVIVGIILLALLFSILNTMLMAVLERVREIGMLMAIGMTKPQVFKMIMYETVMLSMLGAPLGLFISWTFVSYFGTAGIDLGGAAYGDLGFSNVVYPFLASKSYIDVTVMVLVMSILAAIYPALKALRLIPVEAIRKI